MAKKHIDGGVDSACLSRAQAVHRCKHSPAIRGELPRNRNYSNNDFTRLNDSTYTASLPHAASLTPGETSLSHPASFNDGAQRHLFGLELLDQHFHAKHAGGLCRQYLPLKKRGRQQRMAAFRFSWQARQASHAIVAFRNNRNTTEDTEAT